MVDKGKYARLEEVNQGEIARLEEGDQQIKERLRGWRKLDQGGIDRLEEGESRRNREVLGRLIKKGLKG